MKKYFILILVSAFILSSAPVGFAATDEEIKALKQQVQELMQRIEKLETDQTVAKTDAAKAKEEVAKIKESRVDLTNASSRLKLKGFWAAGYLASGKSGSYGSGSFEVPEGRLAFIFQPDKINTLMMRFFLKNAAANTPLLDMFLLKSKDFLPFLKDTPFSISSRIGKFKLGFGEETWSNNVVEGVLPSNSAANVDNFDEGVELSGEIKLNKIKLNTLGWIFSVTDGNSGVGSDTSTAKAFMGKFYYTPIDPLYLSASYYNSGELKASSAAMTIAGLIVPPTGATQWKRKAWELDLRYDIGKGKKPLEPIAYSDSKAILRLSYGKFTDEATSATKRNGQFGFVEGTYNWTKKFYAAARYSLLDLTGDNTATLNSVTANKYCRYSLGLGYRFSENTILKLGYDWNTNSGPGVVGAEDNLLSLIVATQF